MASTRSLLRQLQRLAELEAQSEVQGGLTSNPADRRASLSNHFGTAEARAAAAAAAAAEAEAARIAAATAAEGAKMQMIAGSLRGAAGTVHEGLPSFKFY